MLSSSIRMGKPSLNRDNKANFLETDLYSLVSLFLCLSLLDLPMSRLSKRMTWYPELIRCWQNRFDHTKD